MTTNTWWMLLAVALAAGVAGGGWFALRMARARFDAQLRRATEELHQKHAAMGEKLRAAQVRTQTELEQSRSSFKRQLAVMAAEPRAALERTEERLKAAYAELDRLRGSKTPAPSLPEDGFAATQPMHKGM